MICVNLQRTLHIIVIKSYTLSINMYSSVIKIDCVRYQMYSKLIYIYVCMWVLSVVKMLYHYELTVFEECLLNVYHIIGAVRRFFVTLAIPGVYDIV